MIQQFLANRFEAVLLQLKNEINSYTHKENIWKITGDIKNSSGTLCLHLLGNLNHFIGAGLGKTGYVRNRDGEFSLRNVPSTTLIKEIDETSYRIKEIICNLTDEQIKAPFPLQIHVDSPDTLGYIAYLLGHFNYHLGQINYHRRMTDPPVSLPDGVDKLR